METSKKVSAFLQRLRYKYRLSIYRDETYEEVLNLKLSRLNVLVIGGIITFIFLFIVISVIIYTPVREFIPGYPDENTRRDIILNNQRLDSVENELRRRDLYLKNLNSIIAGNVPEDFDNKEDTDTKLDNIDFSRSAEDSLLREHFEEKDPFSLDQEQGKKSLGDISQILFFPPVKGLITNSYSIKSGHYGIDIVAGMNEVVKSTLDGTVIIAAWTLETGWIIQIQHEDNIISVYKHNAELLKRIGDYVKAGEPIAIMGNSGELSTGPHLHFELWQNGISLNPEEYVHF